ncbi:MAG: 16S rRNA (cytosine(1402)-N(4))-methyltransferase RsmH [Rhizomicrobium sp.]
MASSPASKTISAAPGPTASCSTSASPPSSSTSRQRGFSFQADGPLDMRMSKDGMSAADFVNGADEKTLSDVLFRLGEERNARRIARAIIAKRPIAQTAELADIVKEAQGPAAARHPIHPATRTFQALRIHVNDELGELERALAAASTALAPAGRLVVVAFHSLEDRIVKQFFTAHSDAAPNASRHAPATRRAEAVSFRLLAKGALKPGDAEVHANPRARSARLRAGVRLAA